MGCRGSEVQILSPRPSLTSRRSRTCANLLEGSQRDILVEKSGELIESYNTGSRNTEQLFEELLRLANNLDEEQERHSARGARVR